MSQARSQTDSLEDRTSQTISDAANMAGAAVRDATRQFRSAASDIGSRVSSRAHDAVGELAHRVEQQPLSALLIAGGVGLLAGLLLARR